MTAHTSSSPRLIICAEAGAVSPAAATAPTGSKSLTPRKSKSKHISTYLAKNFLPKYPRLTDISRNSYDISVAVTRPFSQFMHSSTQQPK
jgi:hypothetical protein